MQQLRNGHNFCKFQHRHLSLLKLTVLALSNFLTTTFPVVMAMLRNVMKMRSALGQPTQAVRHRSKSLPVRAETQRLTYSTVLFGLCFAVPFYFMWPIMKNMSKTHLECALDGPHAHQLHNEVPCDIPIPLDEQEEFDTDILIAWFEDQKARGNM